MLLENSPILVDFDSVICDFDVKCMDWFNVRNMATHTRADITTWDWVRKQPGSEIFWNNVFHSEWFNESLAPLPGAIEALEKLIDAGADVHVVTSRPVGHEAMLRAWFKENSELRPGRNFRLHTTGDKLEYFKFHDMVTWFEDAPHNIVDLATVAPGYIVDAPYNESIPPTTFSVSRVPTLREGVEHLLRMNVTTR